jgi:hypothetical protein
MRFGVRGMRRSYAGSAGFAGSAVSRPQGSYPRMVGGLCFGVVSS